MEVHVPSSALRPIHYDLRIDPYIDEARFDGSVTIKVHALEATPSIALNAHNILIHDTKLKDQDGIPIMISDASTNTSLQTFSIVLELPLPADCYVYLSLDFSGPLDRSGTGIFITDVLSSSPMLSTLFEPMQARTVFPCFDEPCFKATFSLSIDVPTGLKCLGNTFIKSEGPVTPIRKRRIVFDKTPPLPTYLLAFAIGDFDMIESNEFRIPIRAYVPWTYDIKHCRHLLEIAAKVLAIYETMFGIDCGLTKLDFLAVPASVAAMENWGLITISTAVAFISSDSSVTEKLRTAQLVAHEIAHQWFGNIVTIESWDNYWLKEALADWAEVSAMEQLSNSEPWREFVAETMQDALWLDSSQFSHPLVAPIEAGKDVYLDDIIYGKGCAVLRMLAGFVGKDVFLDGIRRLLRQNIHSNGCPEDLWDIFSNLSGVDIGKLMKSWTETTGHPSVIVEENEAEGTITLTQQRLCLSGAEDSTLYSIPLAVRTGTGVVTELLDERCKTIKVTFDFYKINAGEVGFYRVAYPKSRLQKLAGEARKGTLSVEDRIALVADTAALAFGGHPSVTTADLLNLLQDFREEQNFFVWWTITATLKNFSRRLLFEDDAVRTAFALYQKNLVRKCLDRLSNMQPSDDNGGRFRALVLMSSGGNETVVALTKALFTQYVSGEEQPITPNIRAEVFEVVLKRGSKKEYNALLSKLRSATGSTRKDILLSLGHCSNTTCIKKTLELCTTPAVLADLSLRDVLAPLTTHKKGIFALWRFISSGAWSKIPGLSFEKITPVGEMLLENLTKQEFADGARKYLQNQDSNMLGQDAERLFEGIEARARWLGSNRPILIEWLKERGHYKRAPNGVQRAASRVKDILEFLGYL